jgi:hypothetical protein
VNPTPSLFVFAAASALVISACSGNDTSTYPREKLLDPATCKECHQSHYDEWSGSMHAYASVDPVFRAMNQRGQDEAMLGDFCVKCHAPMAVQEGATKDGTNLDSVPDSLQGVTCYFCHQVSAVHGSSNAALDLASDTTMRGEVADPVANRAHGSKYSTLHDDRSLDSSNLCGSCHDISVPAHFSGAVEDVALERTYSEWQGSLFATSKAPLTCSGCHFATGTGGTIANYPGVKSNRTRHMHDFPGVDVALTDFPKENTVAQKAAQRNAVEQLLTRAVALTVCANQNHLARVTVENRGAGHGAPSGASADRRMWLEVEARNPSPDDPDGKVIFTSGAVPDGTPVVGFVDPDGTSPKVFRDTGLDAAGNPAHLFWKIASIVPGSLNAPVTSDTRDPRYHAVGDVVTLPAGGKAFSLPGFVFESGSIRVTVHVRPVGLDVLDDLYSSPGASGDGTAVRAAMPTLDLLPNEGVPATVEWTMAGARTQGTSGSNGELCVSSASVNF